MPRSPEPKPVLPPDPEPTPELDPGPDPDPTYAAAEFETQRGAESFGVQIESVSGALHLAGISPTTRVTRAEVEHALHVFLTRTLPS